MISVKECFLVVAAISVASGQLAMPGMAPIPTNGFSYAVNDHAGNEHSHTQNQIGAAKTGQYKVALPDGRLQTVTYVADAAGYRAKVDYTPYVPGSATTSGDAQVAALASVPPTAPAAVAAAAVGNVNPMFGGRMGGMGMNPYMMGGMYGNGMYGAGMGMNPYGAMGMAGGNMGMAGGNMGMYGGAMGMMGGRMGGFGAYPIQGGYGMTSPYGSSFGYQTPFSSVSQYNNGGFF